jgi:hypothetical protein
VATIGMALFTVAACSGGDTERAATTEAVVATTSSPPEVVGSVVSTVPDTTAAVATTASAPSTTPELVELPEVGVPGLDSDDPFCAGWSQWAGSYQVLGVADAFGEGGAERLAALEVIAAPAVIAAFDAMVVAWPDELDVERTTASDGFLGPLTRRLELAHAALVDAGADEAMIATISASWVEALARRDPTSPEFAVDLPDEIWKIVDDASAAYAGRVVRLSADPSLIVVVDTPLTDEYLAVSCPDQGTLSGQEVDPNATGG